MINRPAGAGRAQSAGGRSQCLPSEQTGFDPSPIVFVVDFVQTVRECSRRRSGPSLDRPDGFRVRGPGMDFVLCPCYACILAVTRMEQGAV